MAGPVHVSTQTMHMMMALLTQAYQLALQHCLLSCHCLTLRKNIATSASGPVAQQHAAQERRKL